VVVLLMLVIMLWSLFRNASGETLFCELIVLHFFVFRKESNFKNYWYSICIVIVWYSLLQCKMP
jgi:hypothetical protein